MVSDEHNTVAQEPIAVVGLAFQFPGGANTEEKLWKLMLERRCVTREYPKDRFNIDLYNDSSHIGVNKVSKNGSFTCALSILIRHDYRLLPGLHIFWTTTLESSILDSFQSLRRKLAVWTLNTAR
jgi:hypothetical protein